MPKGTKIDNKKAAEIIASYALTNSYNATAKECGVSDKTVKKIILDNPKEYEKKKETFVIKADRIIDKSLELLEDRINTALYNKREVDKLIDAVFDCDENGDEKITRKEKLEIAKKLSRLQLNNLSEITTALGTLVDKKRLVQGESTNNDTITIKMSNEVKELSK